MIKPIYEAIIKYIEEDNTVFHMPGHRQGKLLSFSNQKSILEFDLTEVEGLDNLHNPTECILESQKNIAAFYGADKTLYSINGSSGAILAMIMGCINKGDKVIVERGCHRSVYNAICLANAKPIYAMNEYDRYLDILYPADVNQLIDLAIKNDAKAVVVTRPTYFGACLDLQFLCNELHKHNILVLVDEAHGAHMVAFDNMPKTANECGADVCVQSLHKTIPAMNQTALLHINGLRVDENRIKRKLSMVQTTSPSYVLLASMELGCEYLQNITKKEKDHVNKLLNEMCTLLTKSTGFKIINISDKYTFDWMRLVINCADTDFSGTFLSHLLRHDYSIQVEMANEKNIVCILAISDFYGDSSPISRLFNSLIDIWGKRNSFDCNKTTLDFKTDYWTYIPKSKMDICDSINCDMSLVFLDEAIGCVAGDYLTPYPPGIPLICPGEVIDEKVVDVIKNLISNGIKVDGVDCQCRIWRLV